MSKTTYTDAWRVFLLDACQDTSPTNNRVLATYTSGGTSNGPSGTDDFQWPGVSGGVDAGDNHLAWIPIGIELNRTAGTYNVWLARKYETGTDHSLTTVDFTNLQIITGANSMYLLETMDTSGLNVVRHSFQANLLTGPPPTPYTQNTQTIKPSSNCIAWGGFFLCWVPTAPDNEGPGYQVCGFSTVGLDNPQGGFNIGEPVKTVTIDPDMIPEP